MASLRTGPNEKECNSCIINNYRPPLPLGNRSVGLFTGETVPVREQNLADQDISQLKLEGNIQKQK